MSNFADKRIRAIARRASRRCETKTLGSIRTVDGRDGWEVAVWQSSAVASVIRDACREAVRQDRLHREPPTGHTS